MSNGITCKICGGTDFVVQGDFMVCQACGVKYSLDEARAMAGAEPVQSADAADSAPSQGSPSKETTPQPQQGTSVPVVAQPEAVSASSPANTQKALMADMLASYENEDFAQTVQNAQQLLEYYPDNVEAKLYLALAQGRACPFETLDWDGISENAQNLVESIFAEEGGYDAKVRRNQRVAWDVFSFFSYAFYQLRDFTLRKGADAQDGLSRNARFGSMTFNVDMQTDNDLAQLLRKFCTASLNLIQTCLEPAHQADSQAFLEHATPQYMNAVKVAFQTMVDRCLDTSFELDKKKGVGVRDELLSSDVDSFQKLYESWIEARLEIFFQEHPEARQQHQALVSAQEEAQAALDREMSQGALGRLFKRKEAQDRSEALKEALRKAEDAVDAFELAAAEHVQ